MSDVPAPDDTPEAVARGLGELAHIAGARVAVLEHLDKQVKAALAAVVAAQAKWERQQREAQRMNTRRFLALLVLVVLLAAGVIVNRASLSSTQRNVNRHIDFAAICASKTPGNDAAIEACISSHLP